MLEKMAYWNVLLQLPIYIAQKDAPGGLHWEQTLKGIIFFWWALVQNFSPVFFGWLSEKYSDKKVFTASFIIIFSSYLLLSVSKDLYSFIAFTILLGIGSAMFKPTMQGALAKELNQENQSRGWGTYFMLINIAVFMAPPISKYLKEISWFYIFFGSAVITFFNFLLNLFFNKASEIKPALEIPNFTLKNVFENLFRKDILIFVLSMSGFAIIYMQFYETLPNFFYDWTNTTEIAKNLPDFMLMKTPLGKMISYEWLYNLNAILVLLFVVLMSIFTSKINILKAIIIGISLSVVGLVFSGISTYGWITIFGIIAYTFGEMITNPKFTQYLSEKAGTNSKAMYLSYLNISFGIGLTFGSIFGAWLYQTYAEKSELAAKYLWEHHQIFNLNNSNSFQKLKEIANITDLQAIDLLFNNYHPYVIWIPFVIISIFSIIGLTRLIKIDKK